MLPDPTANNVAISRRLAIEGRTMDFKDTFKSLTGNPPFPWQEALYQRFIGEKPEEIPTSCSLPTGLGKTPIVAVWREAITCRPTS